MNGFISEIKNFYVYYHTTAAMKPENTNEWVIKTSLCNRIDFCQAACEGVAFLVYHVCLTLFFAMALVFTAGLVAST